VFDNRTAANWNYGYGQITRSGVFFTEFAYNYNLVQTYIFTRCIHRIPVTVEFNYFVLCLIQLQCTQNMRVVNDVGKFLETKKTLTRAVSNNRY